MVVSENGATKEGRVSNVIKRLQVANIATAQVETLGIQKESRPKLKKKKMTARERWEGEGTVKGKKVHTCVATHTTRDALFLFLCVGFCVEVEDDVCLFSLCDD